jgi:nitrite reductase/ring-hydroxylating ferredoxin subunit
MSDPHTLPSRPAWEADFPQERLETEHVTRREFAKFLVVVSGGMTVGSAVIAVKDDLVPQPAIAAEGMRICAVDELPVGGTKAFVLPGTHLPAIVVRPDADTFRAFEQKCTHLSCAVFFSPEKDHIVCPCHNGGFDARTGHVLYGPPPRPLRQFAVEARNGEIVLVGEVARPAHSPSAHEAPAPLGDAPACGMPRA